MGKPLCRGLVRAVTGRAVPFVLLQTIHEGPFYSMALARCLTQGENHPRMFKAIVYEIFRLKLGAECGDIGGRLRDRQY
jgi:hypothetical protein